MRLLEGDFSVFFTVPFQTITAVCFSFQSRNPSLLGRIFNFLTLMLADTEEKTLLGDGDIAKTTNMFHHHFKNIF